jgi:glycerophosphodiester phosphodiesterase
VEMGYHVAPWPVGDESRRDLRSVLKQNPEIIVTNKPEIVMAILQGQKAQ